MSSQLAFMFPGQGSQAPGMLSDLYEASPEVRNTFAEASEALAFDLWKMISSGDAETLALTENTQPVLLASSIAVWRLWCAQGGRAPDCMAGHSLGEFSALAAAGAVSFDDALRLVRLRGRAMQEAVPVGVGAMAAVLGAENEIVETTCAAAAAELDQCVTPVNYNSPGQLVIAGHREAVDSVLQRLRELGVKKAVPLPVSAPFHTPLMRPASESLKEALASVAVSEPEVPVVHNVHAQPERDPGRIRELLVEQMYRPVLWTRCIGTMADRGATRFFECGPGKVLCGLLRRIDRSLEACALGGADAMSTALTMAAR